jgi:hypothetical protein
METDHATEPQHTSIQTFGKTDVGTALLLKQQHRNCFSLRLGRRQSEFLNNIYVSMQQYVSQRTHRKVVNEIVDLIVYEMFQNYVFVSYVLDLQQCIREVLFFTVKTIEEENEEENEEGNEEENVQFAKSTYLFQQNHVYRRHVLFNSFITDACPICLEQITHRDFVRLNCGHILHEDCLIYYLSNNECDRHMCSICRNSISYIMEQRLRFKKQSTAFYIKLIFSRKCNLRYIKVRSSLTGWPP